MSCPAALHLSGKAGEAGSPEGDLGPLRREVDPLHQEPDDAGLLGREQLIPQGVELMQGGADVPFRGFAGSSFSTSRAVPTTISGCRKMTRSWLMTAPSISSAGTRRTEQVSGPTVRTEVVT